MNSNKLKLALQILITGALFYTVFVKIDWTSLQHAFVESDLSLFALSSLVLVLILFLPALSHNILFRSVRLNIATPTIYRINLVSMFYSLVLPGDVGSALARLLKFTNAHRGNKAEGLTGSVLVVMAIDRTLNMATFIVATPILLALFPLPEGNSLYLKISLGILGAFIAVLTALHFVPIRTFARKLPTRAGVWIQRNLGHLSDAYRLIRPIELIKAFALDLAYQFLCVVAVEFLLLQSVGISIPFVLALPIICIIRLLRFVPITLSGLGIREGLYPFFLGQYGVGHEQALILGLMGSATVIGLGLVGGVVELATMKKSPKTPPLGTGSKDPVKNRE